MIYQPELQHQDEGLGRAIWISIAAHAIVFAAFVVRMVIYPSDPLTLDNAIRVDIVALPDKAPKNMPMVETKIPPPSPQPLPETKEPDPVPDTPKPPTPVAVEPAKPVKTAAPEKINLKATKKAQDSALKRLEALERIEKMQKSSKARPAPQPLKGNQISRGSQLSGVTRLEQQSYLQTIDGSVKSHWNLPGFLSNANLSARARLFIDGKGNVVKRVITQSSHNDVYDSRVLAAIDASSPLPAPPTGLVNILEVDGIELEFVPQ